MCFGFLSIKYPGKETPDFGAESLLALKADNCPLYEREADTMYKSKKLNVLQHTNHLYKIFIISMKRLNVVQL